MRVIMLLLGLLVLSCGAAVSSQVTKTHSEFDGATEFRMEPVWACSMCQIKIGVYRTTKMPANAAVMVVQLASTGFVMNPVFASGKSLSFMVDDKLYSFEAKGPTNKNKAADTKKSTVDTQEYNTTKDFLKTLINGTLVTVKVKLVGGKYLDGIFPDWGLTTIRSGLADFYQQAF